MWIPFTKITLEKYLDDLMKMCLVLIIFMSLATSLGTISEYEFSARMNEK